MRSSSLWFGPVEHRLFGRLDVPDSGSARAGVVLCPPFGTEFTSAARTYKVLSERLEAEGFAVLRVDYEGTGDSSGSGDEDARVEAWRASVRAGVELLRSGGTRRIAIVGMRLGATVAASVATECGLDALVLWDPCASGRSYLREQQALRSVHLGDQGHVGTFSANGDDSQAAKNAGVEILGELYSSKTVAELSKLSIDAAEGDLALRLLVLTRAERRPLRSMVERLSMAHAEWGEAAGQEELVGVQPGMAEVPERTVGEISAWLSATLSTQESQFSIPACERAVVERRDDGETVEEIVRLGPLGLFGILTSPERSRSSVTAVILNSGVVDHVGPGRLWVNMARQWAREGIPTLRVDLSGLGDSPARPGQEQGVMYPPEFFDDLGEISKAISPEDPSAIVLVGLCSGGYHSIEGGVSLGVRGVCLVNPIIPRNPLNQPNRTLAPRPADPRRRATAARKPWVSKLPAHDTLAGLAERLPGAAWWLFDRIAVECPPAVALERVVERGVDTLAVCGEHEARVITRGEGAVLRRLRRTGRFRLEVLPEIDHELFQRAARDRVESVLTSHLVELLIPPNTQSIAASQDPSTKE